MRYTCLLLILVVAINTLGCSAQELCPQENCFADSTQCEELVRGVGCSDPQLTCCSVVKPEHRTACRHHGGECMDDCSLDLQRDVIDCSGDTVCCVLV